ncbi:glycosyltransferase [Salinibacterium sp. ZJ454]|uniref:glycosyltransferase n=1 Tax=Salinibacterium sp. ZJ454 TaxID=2708339 RepID=UPI001422B1CB|nr:glycosyltransferase [Salinibacterium sp. ZJ454]
MRILLWHVHGSWTDAFVRGPHHYLLPWSLEGGAWGLGRAERDWPGNVENVTTDALAEADIDVVVLQRPEELAVAERALHRRLGRDIPAVYVEHNTPRQDVPNQRHPLADQRNIPIVHVTHFNHLLWDSGDAPTTVIEHGVVDPGELYTGRLPHFGVVINEPVRRWRVTGTDLLPAFAGVGHVDFFGMGTDMLPDATGLSVGELTVIGDLPLARLHARLAECRVYLHPVRWTSLGLALIEAMHLGMPVIALASTEVPRAVPPEAGAVSTNVHDLLAAGRRLLGDPDEARALGRVARAFALEHYGLAAFLRRWDEVLGDVSGTEHRNTGQSGIEHGGIEALSQPARSAR